MHSLNLPSTERADINLTFHKYGTQAAVAKVLSVWWKIKLIKATFRELANSVRSIHNGQPSRKIHQYVQQKVTFIAIN